MACDRFARALKDRALGAPLAADAAAHLAVCSSCQMALGLEEELCTTIGQALNDVGSVTPAPEFVSRVRARVEDTPRRRFSGWWMPAFGAAAAGLIVAAFVTTLVTRNPAVADRTALSKSTPEPVVVDSQAEMPAAPARLQPRVASTRRTRRPVLAAVEPGHETPEVLVPTGQRQAVGRLFYSMRSGRRDVSPALLTGDDGVVATPQALAIAPIQIIPVVVPPLPLSTLILDK